MTTNIQNFQDQLAAEFTQLLLHKLRHELTNAVRPMAEIPQWIEEDIVEEGFEIPTSLRENLDMLGSSSQRLTQMIEDLLTYAHINQHLETEPTVLSEIISDLVDDTLPNEFKLTTNLTCDTLPVTQPDAVTLIDALLSNAIKHHDRGCGKIDISCKKIGNTTQLTICDDGPGIEEKYIDQIFDPLTTLVSRDQIEGSGMGLALVRRIAFANNGYVKAISATGKRGTCIVVWFP